MEKKSSKLDISYYGYFTPFGGYGIANFNWVKHLRRLGVNVYPHGKFMPREGEKEFDILNEEEKNIASTLFKKEKIGIIETTPFDFETIDTEIKIANTMCESDEIGDPWVKACNGMNYVIVPNEFQLKAFLKSGVSSEKLKLIPHGTEIEKFPYFEREEKDLFTFGIIGWLNDRKGVFDVIQAFSSEFELHERVRLVLHSTNPDFSFYKFFNDPRITTDCTYMDFHDLNSLYRSFDCFVFPSKAEGIGQPPREAMSTGLPVIVGNYSGLQEICQEDICYPLQVKELVRGINPNNIEQPGHWANYDIQELMYFMRYVFEHRKEAKHKGKLASDFIKSNFSWEFAAIKMKEFLETL